MRRALVALLLLGLPTPAHAWNTADEGGWLAVFLKTEVPGFIPGSTVANEHSVLTHRVLERLGLASCFGLEDSASGTGQCWLLVNDLNAALNRPELSQLPNPDDIASTPLEERKLPPPAHFGGMPDYNWAIYDWINKSSLCPAVAPGNIVSETVLDCHAFLGWMGLLNANHFGTQATNMYAHYHALALSLAQRARDLRALLEQGLPADRDAWADFVREAELEALAYEVFGQHFLQDRWSVGHMFERWNGADNATYGNVPGAAEAAVVSGLIHGSQGVTGIPDAMSSPVISLSPLTRLPQITAVTWRNANGPPEPGVGDYRLDDMHARNFSGFPLPVANQELEMLRCAADGLREVVLAFGPNDRGGYGAWGVTPDGTSPSDVLRDAKCWDNWATNSAIQAGWQDDLVARLGLLARAALKAVSLPSGAFSPNVGRTTWVDLAWRIDRAVARDGADATTLARGGLGPIGLGAIQPGNAYATSGGQTYLPDYAEPADLATLPVQDPHPWPRGRDKSSIFGFFNRAHADYWCDDVQNTLSGLRGSKDRVELGACALLADRVYKGVDPSYTGAQQEARSWNGEASDPICSYYGVTAAAVDPDLPYWLHPGYVAAPGQLGTYAYDSVHAWCRRVAILDEVVASDEENECSVASGASTSDVVGVASGSEQTVTLRGRDLGTAGEVWIGVTEGAGFDQPIPVQSWSSTEIAVDARQLPTGDYFVQVRPASGPDQTSVGRFILRVLGAGSAPYVTEVRFLGPLVPGEDVDMEISVGDAETAADLTQGDESVTVVSGALRGVMNPIVGGARAGLCGATFTATDTVRKPVNDRSNCDPGTWDVHATPTDSARFPDAALGPALTGATFDTEVEVENVRPFVDPAFAVPAITVAPGGVLSFDVEVTDDNNDHHSRCEELPASNVSVVSSTVLAVPELDADAPWDKIATNVSKGTSTFRMEVTVQSPHRDNERVAGPGCALQNLAPFEITWTAEDDAGEDLVAAPDPVEVWVRNMAPRVPTFTATPGALHPGVATTVRFDVGVDDANFKQDVLSVEVATGQCGGLAAPIQLRPVVSPADGRWQGSALLRANELCVVLATAVDDNCARSVPALLSIPVENVAPTWTGFIAGHDGDPIECATTIDYAVGFTDENGDGLAVIAILDGEEHIETELTRVPGTNRYVGSEVAPCAGDYTLTFRATETTGPQGPLLVTLTDSVTLTVLAGPPEDCPDCHPGGTACDPQNDECCDATGLLAGCCFGAGPAPGAACTPTCEGFDGELDEASHLTLYTLYCSDPGDDALTFEWSTPSCGTLTPFEPGVDSSMLWSHPEPPCDASGEASESITVEVSDGHYRISCSYDGASSGSGSCGRPEASP